MKYIFFIYLCCIMSLQLSGQNLFSVSGKVVDKDNKPLPGANIYLPELEVGTISDSLGFFKLNNLPAGVLSLRISYIAYETILRSIDTDHQTSPLIVSMKSSPIQAKAVVISGGMHSSQHENAIKIEAINRIELDRAGEPSFLNALAKSPGVDVISKGGGVATPVIRGLSTSNILFLNNGIRLENFQFSENHPYLIDEYGASQIEIIKGPASLLYGSDAVGGVINTIPEGAATVNTLSGDIHGRYHSNTDGFSGSFGIKSTRKSFSAGLRAGVKTHKDYRGGDSELVPNTRFNTNSFKTFASYRKGRALTRLYYNYQNMKIGLATDEAITLVSDDSRKNEVWYQDLVHHMITSKSTFFLKHYKLLVNASYQNNHRLLVGEEDEPGHELVDMLLQTANIDIRNIFTQSEHMSYTLAVQSMLQKNKNNEAPNRVLPDYGLYDISLFGMVQYSSHEKIHIQLGGRFDNRFLIIPEQEKSAHSHEHDESEESEVHLMMPLDRYYGNVSFSIGMTYNIADDLLLRTNIASAYRSPNIAELSQDGEHGVRYEQGDRDLKPQRNYEFDISTHWHKVFFMVDIAAFYNKINNYIYLEPTADTSDEGLTIYRYQQDPVVLYGFEGIVEVLPVRNFNISLNYSYVKGEKENGEYLPFIPQNKLSSRIKYEIRGKNWLERLNFRVELMYAFSQDRPALLETTTSAYSLLNIGSSMMISLSDQVVEFDVSANNLLNEKYIDHLSTLKNTGYYNMGRNVSFSIRIPLALKFK